MAGKGPFSSYIPGRRNLCIIELPLAGREQRNGAMGNPFLCHGWRWLCERDSVVPVSIEWVGGAAGGFFSYIPGRRKTASFPPRMRLELSSGYP